MTAPEKESNTMETLVLCRRFRPRTYPRGFHVAWAEGTGTPLLRADVADISDSGVGLLVPALQAPSMGRAIRVVSRRDQPPRAARVIRISPQPGGRAKLGCRWISSAEKRKQAGQPRTIRESRRSVVHKEPMSCN